MGKQKAPPLPPPRASKRLKLVRAAQEKLQPKSNQALAALPKSSFIHSVVSALPARDEAFYSSSEGTARRGPIAKGPGGGPRHVRQYMATNAEDAAPPKGQVIRTLPNEVHVRELHAIARRKKEEEAAAASKSASKNKKGKGNKKGGAAAVGAGGGGAKKKAAVAKRPRAGSVGRAGPSSTTAARAPRRAPLAAVPVVVPNFNLNLNNGGGGGDMAAAANTTAVAAGNPAAAAGPSSANAASDGG